MLNKVYKKTIEFIKENLWFLISLIAIILLFTIELPYVVELPGGFVSLKERIIIENKNDTNSDLGMAYVTMLKGNIPFLLFSLVNNDFDIVAKKDITYENESTEEMNIRDNLLMNEANSNATIAAYSEAGEYFNILSTKIFVAGLDNDDSELKVGDNIIKINDNKVNDLNEMKNYLQTLSLDKKVKVTVIRDDKEKEVYSSLKDYDGVKKLGVIIVNNYDIETKPKLEIKKEKRESGPSGGLMTALAIYDELTSSNLTHGDKIIGTGTISKDGTVGEIGGVKYKLIGAVNNKAKVFLCPKDNYEEAQRIAKERNFDIIIKDVETLSEAINYLKSR